MIFTSESVASKNHWRIPARVTKKLFMATHISFHYLNALVTWTRTQEIWWKLSPPPSPVGQLIVILWRHAHTNCDVIWPIVLETFLSWSHVFSYLRQFGYHSLITKSDWWGSQATVSDSWFNDIFNRNLILVKYHVKTVARTNGPWYLAVLSSAQQWAIFNRLRASPVCPCIREPAG